MDRTGLAELLDTGATFAEIAKKTNTYLWDVFQLAKVNGLTEKSVSGLRREVVDDRAVDLSALLVDDDDGFVINGIDTRTSDGKINARDIIVFYHGESRCPYSGDSTDTIMPADGNPNNFLLSNLIPITERVVAERFAYTCFVQESTTRQFLGPGPKDGVTVTLRTEHKFDRLLGGGLDQAYAQQAFDSWLEPYLNSYTFHEILECFDCRATPVSSALWIWRQLEKKAMLKGMDRLILEFPSKGTVCMTKGTVLNQTQQLLQRQFNSRRVTPASSMPTEASRARLVKP